jgi:L-aspartate oxidase
VPDLPFGTADIRLSEVLVVGTGVAGLAAALGCSPRSVTVLTKARLGEGGSSAWAQGGVAAAVGGDDSPELHAADTLAVSGGLGDPEVVSLLTREGPVRIGELIALGARFDGAGGAAADGARGLHLGREAAHSRRRILHAGGDATGAELVRALVAAVRRAPGVRVEEACFAVDLVLAPAPGRPPFRDACRVAGVVALAADGRRVVHLAGAVVLATGGCGQLYRRTTNPAEVTADGLAMAARAGARLVDVEMMQFHPTALAAGEANGPLALLTEALRGEGAVLVDGAGRRFMAAEHPDAELAPRDVVARAIHRRREAGEAVFLDARGAVGEAFPERFPTVFEKAMAVGLDPRREPLPVTPAAHYHMGGVEVDARGRSSLPGLWACGETASTGAHGANRLASNSLLEALVFGARVAGDLKARLAGLPGTTGEALARLRVLGEPVVAHRSGKDGNRSARVGNGGLDRVGSLRERLRRIMWRRVGLVRDGAGLAAAQAELSDVGADLEAAAAEVEGAGDFTRRVALYETRNLLTAARLVAAAALVRCESRGAHHREDFPAEDPAQRHRLRAWIDRTGAVRVGDPIPVSEPLPATGSPPFADLFAPASDERTALAAVGSPARSQETAAAVLAPAGARLALPGDARGTGTASAERAAATARRPGSAP